VRTARASPQECDTQKQERLGGADDDSEERTQDRTMAYSFPPAPGRPDDPAGDAQCIPQMASRSTRRPLLRSVLPRILALAMTLALLAGVFVLVHTNTSSSTPVRSVTTSTGTNITGAQTSSRVSSAPDFTLTTLGGGTFHLASQQGHVVVLYFMATGCAGCEPGSSALAQGLQTAKVRGAEVLAIDVNPGDRPADLQAFVQSLGIPASAPVQWGIDTTGAIARAYNVQALETTVVIDRHGQVAYRSDGAVPPEQLAQIVRNLA
jgi:cytochrome c biogenesis protein CcmG/thiol:disulfide interchange protein DsbE